MKHYMIQTWSKLFGWRDAYLCATREEAVRKVQRWDGPTRIRACRR